MMGASRQGGHEEQTQLLDQVLQHVVGVGELVAARQLQGALWRVKWIHISHLTMEIGGRSQHGITERVGVVHIEQGHLPV